MLHEHLRQKLDHFLANDKRDYGTSAAVSDKDRTPDMPVDEQVRASVALEYKINEQWSVGGSYTFLWMGENNIDQTMPLAGRIVGDYEAFAHIFGIYGSVNF